MMEKPLQKDSPLITVANLSQAYFRKKVIKKASFNLFASEIVGLLGPNGAGKTTLLKLLCGLLKKNSGSIDFVESFGGVSLYLPDGFLYEDLTLRENINLFASIFNSSLTHCDQIVEALSLSAFYDSHVRFLSRGQRVRGALCRTLLVDADLYLFDEPFTGLDKESVHNLIEILKNYKTQGKSICLSTHNPEYIQSVTDRWFRLSDGSVVAGTTM